MRNPLIVAYLMLLEDGYSELALRFLEPANVHSSACQGPANPGGGTVLIDASETISPPDKI